MKRCLRNMLACETEKVPLPDSLHFVWLGDKHRLFDNYLSIWQRANPDKTCRLWIDEQTTFCPEFHQLILAHARKMTPSASQDWQRQIKNAAFGYIFPRLAGKRSFNTLAKAFLQARGIIDESFSWRAGALPSSLSPMVVIEDVNTVFQGRHQNLYKYYCYELILRGNLASASDIVRLLVLYQHGGLYIDVDTLPGFDYLFNLTNRFMHQQGIADNQYIALAKTQAVLTKIDRPEAINTSPTRYLHAISTLSPDLRKKLNKCIADDAGEIQPGSILPLHNVKVYPHVLAMGSLGRLKGIYYNNALAACAASKTLSIILRSLKKRYRFLEKNNAIEAAVHEDENVRYLSRLLPWREESCSPQNGVTPALTGPGLILEVILGLCYEIFIPQGNLSPTRAAAFIQNDRFGIAFFQHTLDTPAGLRSSWRKPDEYPDHEG